MNALAIITPAPQFKEWLATGKSLLQQRTVIEWQLADWLQHGRVQFGNQAEFDFLADELGIAPRQLKSAAKVAATFPPHLRSTGLTFEHHESVANLPVTDALAVLKQAEAGHWDDRETRVMAVKRQAEIAPGLLPDIDWAQHQLVTLARAWNRADPAVREEFLEMAAESNGGDIDA